MATTEWLIWSNIGCSVHKSKLHTESNNHKFFPLEALAPVEGNCELDTSCLIYSKYKRQPMNMHGGHGHKYCCLATEMQTNSWYDVCVWCVCEVTHQSKVPSAVLWPPASPRMVSSPFRPPDPHTSLPHTLSPAPQGSPFLDQWRHPSASCGDASGHTWLGSTWRSSAWCRIAYGQCQTDADCQIQGYSCSDTLCCLLWR